MSDVISSFRGDYLFLSNFYLAPICFEGLLYHNNEAAFQSAKIVDYSKRKIFCDMEPSDAKRIGRHLHLRGDWETVKNKVMEDIIRDKFIRNKELMAKLISTGNRTLIEGNTWGDTYWGICNGVGENQLGKSLMKIRNELRDNRA